MRYAKGGLVINAERDIPLVAAGPQFAFREPSTAV